MKIGSLVSVFVLALLVGMSPPALAGDFSDRVQSDTSFIAKAEPVETLSNFVGAPYFTRGSLTIALSEARKVEVTILRGQMFAEEGSIIEIHFNAEGGSIKFLDVDGDGRLDGFMSAPSLPVEIESLPNSPEAGIEMYAQLLVEIEKLLGTSL
ncbi:MAG: hypothetical protein HYT30_00860 [Parcubacteria group bacterium]|nr:hypothetical protein [Parcubacteria group bacterium]